ncbi:MAG: hypothetical protein RLZZ196_3273 [Bacteroidota bacterium]|jgi:uncharacterized protein YlxP (DUF503 family)
MLPKKINKMSLEEQEAYLIKKMQDLYAKESIYRRALAKVRGKTKIDISDLERPDLLEMKDEAAA